MNPEVDGLDKEKKDSGGSEEEEEDREGSAQKTTLHSLRSFVPSSSPCLKRLAF